MQATGKSYPDFELDLPDFQDEEPLPLKPKPEPESKFEPFSSVVIPSRSSSNNQSFVVQPPVFQEAKPEPETKEVPITRREPAAMPSIVDDAPSMRDIELRAIFNTDENFTLRKVSQKVAAIEGIRACAVVTSDRVIEAYADQSYAIGDKIQAMAEHVRGLAEMSGIVGASYFTIHMDHSIMSFFFGKKNLLAVKHKSDAFKPGTREKLILIARSIDNLEN